LDSSSDFLLTENDSGKNSCLSDEIEIVDYFNSLIKPDFINEYIERYICSLCIDYSKEKIKWAIDTFYENYLSSQESDNVKYIQKKMYLIKGILKNDAMDYLDNRINYLINILKKSDKENIKLASTTRELLYKMFRKLTSSDNYENIDKIVKKLSSHIYQNNDNFSSYNIYLNSCIKTIDCRADKKNRIVNQSKYIYKPNYYFDDVKTYMEQIDNLYKNKDYSNVKEISIAAMDWLIKRYVKSFYEYIDESKLPLISLIINDLYSIFGRSLGRKDCRSFKTFYIMMNEQNLMQSDIDSFFKFVKKFENKIKRKQKGLTRKYFPDLDKLFEFCEK
jgi:hypothetical protein